MKKIVIASIAALALGSSLMAAAPASCAGCHGADGSKNTMVPNSVPNKMSKADIKAAMSGYKAGTLDKYGKGALMAGFAKPLTDAQINDVVEAWGK
ncbi:MAG: cytochrome c [Campylobacterota bacterium]|nr:cytochrome c [Campylobacterota bacterium]